MSIIINILLFIFSGIFSLVFFSQNDFYGLGGTMFSRSTALYILGGTILILGGLARILSPEIQAIADGN